MPKIVNVDDKLNYICERAYEELVKNGVGQFSLNKFIDSLNMSKGQFYHYFKTKEELICKAIDTKCYEAFTHTYEAARLQTTFLEKMRTFFAFFLGESETQFGALEDVLKRIFHLYLNSESSAIKQLNREFYRVMFSYIDEMFETMITQGLIKEEGRGLARSFIATVDGMYVHSLMNDDFDMKVSLEAYLKIMDGLLAIQKEQC